MISKFGVSGRIAGRIVGLTLLVCALAMAPRSEGQDAVPAPEGAAQEAADPETVIATVNGEPVTAGELNREIGLMLSRMSSQPLPPQAIEQMRPRLEPQAFNQIVLKKELKSYAKANGVEVTEASVDGQVDQIISQFPNPQMFEQALSQQGMTRDDLEEQIGNQLLVSSAVDHYMDSLPAPTEESLKTYFDEHIDDYKEDESVSASHILIGFEPNDDDAAKGEKKARIEGIKKELDGGADFAALAKEHSSCPSGQQGGDLGEFGKGQMVPEFEKAAFELEPGKVSEVVETQFGYHLIRVSKHDQAGTPSFEEAKEQVEQAVNEAKLESWFEGLIAQAKIEKK